MVAAALCALSPCAPALAGQGAQYVNAYLEHWLKAHDFTAFETRADGVHFSANGGRLDGEINEAKELSRGEFYTVESRFSVTLGDGRHIDDFVAGAGATAQDALTDSLQNLCLTTLHPIYAELFDHDDPHVRKETWLLNGTQRRVFLPEWGERGEGLDDSTQKAVERLLAEELKNEPLTDEFHLGEARRIEARQWRRHVRSDQGWYPGRSLEPPHRGLSLAQGSAILYGQAVFRDREPLNVKGQACVAAGSLAVQARSKS